METKFKVKDKVKYVGGFGGYYRIRGFQNAPVGMNEVLTISAVKKKYGDVIYGFEEDETTQSAHWCNVEKNFELATPNNWNDIIKGDK